MHILKNRKYGVSHNIFELFSLIFRRLFLKIINKILHVKIIFKNIENSKHVKNIYGCK